MQEREGCLVHTFGRGGVFFFFCIKKKEKEKKTQWVGKQDKHLSTNLRTRFQRQCGLAAPTRVVVGKWDPSFSLYSFLLKNFK